MPQPSGLQCTTIRMHSNTMHSKTQQYSNALYCRNTLTCTNTLHCSRTLYCTNSMGCMNALHYSNTMHNAQYGTYIHCTAEIPWTAHLTQMVIYSSFVLHCTTLHYGMDSTTLNCNTLYITALTVLSSVLPYV